MRNIFRNQKGQGLVEYALILALVAVAVAVVLPRLGTAISGAITNVTNSLSGTGGGAATP